MAARTWHGRTSLEKYDLYIELLKQAAIPDYQKTNGFMGLRFLRQLKNNEGHITLIKFWKTLEAIKNFAGQDFEKAKYYPEDDNFLLEFEGKAQHHEVFT